MILFNGLEPAGTDDKVGDNMLAELWRVRADFANKGLPNNKTQLFYKHEWVWKNQNKNTNMEFFNRIIS